MARVSSYQLVQWPGRRLFFIDEHFNVVDAELRKNCPSVVGQQLDANLPMSKNGYSGGGIPFVDFLSIENSVRPKRSLILEFIPMVRKAILMGCRRNVIRNFREAELEWVQFIFTIRGFQNGR